MKSTNKYQDLHAIHFERGNTLFLGDYQAARDKSKLKKLGVKTVLTAAAGLQISYSPEINHRVYPAYDSESFDLSKYFDDSFDFIDEGLKKGSVLVHCAAGISRSATIVIAYIMVKKLLTFEGAYKYVKEKRNVVNPNWGFQKQLKFFERSLR